MCVHVCVCACASVHFTHESDRLVGSLIGRTCGRWWWCETVPGLNDVCGPSRLQVLILGLLRNTVFDQSRSDVAIVKLKCGVSFLNWFYKPQVNLSKTKMMMISVDRLLLQLSLLKLHRRTLVCTVRQAACLMIHFQSTSSQVRRGRGGTCRYSFIFKALAAFDDQMSFGIRDGASRCIKVSLLVKCYHCVKK